VKLLFDVHIAKATVAALRKIAPQIQAEHIADWHGGMLLQADDDEILSKCHTESRVFITYDMATIPDLLRRWIAKERSHSGLFFADENTIKPNHPAELASAVAALVEEIGKTDTTNLIRFLRPVR
jgi:hypothetical protein